MELVITKNFEESGRFVAGRFADVLRQKPDALLGCATGGSVEGVYEALAAAHAQGLDFSRARTVNLDEYAGLPPSHDQSFAYFMDRHFFSRVNIPAENRFLVNGAAEDLDAELDRFNGFIEQNPIDILMVGIGTNGHIGFNEPDAVFPAKAHRVQLDGETIQANARFFPSADQVPRSALTMGMRGILRAKQVVLIATGANKAAAIGRLLQNPDADPGLPCSILRLCARATVVIDQPLHALAVGG